MKKHTRFLAAVLAVLFVFVMASSLYYIITEIDHDCIGEDCHICLQIDGFVSNLKQLSVGVFVAVAAASITYILCAAFLSQKAEQSACTLVSLKVKLSN